MAVTRSQIREIFAKLESGNEAGFFDSVAEDVDWTVEGTHPLAGHYRSKAEFRAGTIAKLARVLPEGARLRVTNIMVCGNWAVVELRSDAIAANGMRFDNQYCWLTHFRNNRIVEVRAYLDSALVQRLFDENAARMAAA